MVDVAGFVGLIKLELPDHVARISEGGTFRFAGELYAPRDSVLGVLTGVEALSEGVAEEAPAATFSFLLPPGGGALALANWQGSRLRAWMAEYDVATGLIIAGTEEQLFDLRADVPRIEIDRADGGTVQTLAIDCVPAAEWLFLKNRGNTLSPQYLKAIYPGARGLDNATGVPTQVAWAAPSAPRGSVSVNGGGGGGGSFDRLTVEQAL